MKFAKRLTQKRWVQKTIGVAAAEYLRLVWMTSRFTMEPADPHRLYKRVRRNLRPLPLCQITRPRDSPPRPLNQIGRQGIYLPLQLSRMRQNLLPLPLCPIRCPLHLPPPSRQIKIRGRPNYRSERLSRLRRHRGSERLSRLRRHRVPQQEPRSREPIFLTDFTLGHKRVPAACVCCNEESLYSASIADHHIRATRTGFPCQRPGIRFFIQKIQAVTSGGMCST
jgi:hypothetical protein